MKEMAPICIPASFSENMGVVKPVPAATAAVGVSATGELISLSITSFLLKSTLPAELRRIRLRFTDLPARV